MLIFGNSDDDLLRFHFTINTSGLGYEPGLVTFADTYPAALLLSLSRYDNTDDR